jgi:hypothetical protein
MKKYTYKVVKRREETVESVSCNKCGDQVNYGLNGVTVSNKWGYGSHKDMITTSFDLCEHCHDEFAKTFKIPIQYTNDDSGNSE